MVSAVRPLLDSSCGTMVGSHAAHRAAALFVDGPTLVYWHTVPGAWNISRVICLAWLMPFTV